MVLPPRKGSGLLGDVLNFILPIVFFAAMIVTGCVMDKWWIVGVGCLFLVVAFFRPGYD